MGYCLNLYCTDLSQNNHCKYITLAQIGLILVNGLVILKLIFIIAKRKKERSNVLDTKIKFLCNQSHTQHYRYGYTWHHLLESSSGLPLFSLSPSSSPFSEPAIDYFHFPCNPVHSKNFQWQTSKAFTVLDFLSSTEGTNTTKFYKYIWKTQVRNSMNRFYLEQILHLGPSTSNVPQHHLTKPSIFHKGNWHFFNKISMFKILLLH